MTSFDLSKKKISKRTKDKSVRNKYYYSISNETFGPYEMESIIDKIDENTLIYTQETDWKIASEFPELKGFLKKENKKSFRYGVIVLVIFLVIVSISSVLTFNYAYQETADEKLIAVGNLKLREFPTAESQEINTYPFGTRIKISDDPPVVDARNRTWNKVLISGSFGWLNPTKGYLVTKDGIVDWVLPKEDWVFLNNFLGNDNAKVQLSSKTKRAFINLFNKGHLEPEWKIYMSDKEEKLKLVQYVNLKLSEKLIDNKRQKSFVGILFKKQPGNGIKNEKKIIILSFLSNGDYYLEYDSECHDCIGIERIKGGSQIRKYDLDFKILRNSDLVVVNKQDSYLYVYNTKLGVKIQKKLKNEFE